MRARILFLIILSTSVAVAAQSGGEDRAELRSRITERFDVVPLTDGVALRPKQVLGGVRLIEVTDVIAVNGETVSAQELRGKLGRDDADNVLRLSYLDTAARKALFEEQPSVEARPGETAPPPTPDLSREEERMRRERRSHGDRVRIFGDVTVGVDEEVSGQAIAVLGSAYINGTVDDQVVAVLGSVHLGPRAVVRGDVVSVGGSVRRDPGAQVRGSLTEVALGDSGFRIHGPDIDWVGGFGPLGLWFGGWGATTRLIGTLFRMGLLLILAGIVVVLARRPVENAAARVVDNPVKATLIGLAGILLAGPVLLLTCLLLAITLIGIPLIFILVPFALLALVVFGIVGFTAVALAVGQVTRRRFLNATTPSVIADATVGIFVLLLPLLIGRLIGIAGWPVAPIAWLFVFAGFGLEFLAWSSGFGAVLANAFSGWQAKRAARATAITPPA